MTTISLEPASQLSSFAVSRGGERLALGFYGEARILDRDGKQLARVDLPSTDHGVVVAFTRAGVALAAQGNVVCVIDGGDVTSITGKFAAEKALVHALAEVAPGVVVIGYEDGSLRRVELVAKRFERSGYKAHKKAVVSIACGAEPGTFFTVSRDRTRAHWHESERAPREQEPTPGVGWLVDGRSRVLVSQSRGDLEIVSSAPTARVPLALRSYVPVGAFGEDGSLAVASDDWLAVFDEKGARIARHVRQADVSRRLAIDGETLFVASASAIEVLPLRARPALVAREIRPRHAGDVRKLFAVGDVIVSLGYDGALKRWDTEGRYLGGTHVHGSVEDVCITDAALVALTARSEVVGLDRTTLAEEWREETRGTERVFGVAAPADARWLALADLRTVVARYDRGASRARFRRKMNRGGQLDWSEAERVLVHVGESDVTVLDEDGAERGVVTKPWLGAPAHLSPDGRRVATLGPRGVEVHTLARLADGPRTVPLALDRPHPFVWSGDEAIWLSLGEEAVRYSLVDGERNGQIASADRITALLALDDRVAIGTNAGDVRIAAQA